MGEWDWPDGMPEDFEDEEPVQFDDVVVVAESSLALQVDIGPGRNWWVPRSQLMDQITIQGLVRKTGDRGSILISNWWVEQKERPDGEIEED